MDIAQKSSLRILFLLNLLYDNEFSKNEIIEEFSKNEIEIKRTSINNYIEKLKSYGFPIITRQVKNTNYYSLDKNENVFLKQEELDASNDIKKILI